MDEDEHINKDRTPELDLDRVRETRMQYENDEQPSIKALVIKQTKAVAQT
jgi:hypothetical protein